MSGDTMTDGSFRYIADDGTVTTIWRIYWTAKGGADFEQVEDPDGGPKSYRISGTLYRPLNPEFVKEARESDRNPVELRRERAAAGEIDDPETIQKP